MLIISIHADSTDHSEISFRLPFIILMTLLVLFIIIMVILITFIVHSFRKKRNITIPVVESVTTQVVEAEYEDITPNMNNNPAYNTIFSN